MLLILFGKDKQVWVVEFSGAFSSKSIFQLLLLDLYDPTNIDPFWNLFLFFPLIIYLK